MQAKIKHITSAYFIRFVFVTILIVPRITFSQSTIQVFPDSIVSPISTNFKPGVFYVPKTAVAVTDFMSNGIQQNVIRTNIIESVLNNTSNLNGCLTLLSTVKTDLKNLSAKCNKLIFIFEKMPAWLSSSSDGSPAVPPGWYVLNTKPPANWNNWQTAVDSITSKIINQFGITNAWFEIWNEPDLGSWTGTSSEYFTLYKRTFDGIKSANSSAKVGGPAVNFWANNITWQAPYGYISNSKADSSLISQLLDTAVIANKVPDFISFHNFNLSYQAFANATNYIRQKIVSLSLPNIPIIVSEWNAPFAVRDTRLATSYLLKTQIEFSKLPILNNAIAAWQDFTQNSNEFHNDYGLLTYGGIRKPAYNGILLSEKLNGVQCKMGSLQPFDGVCSILNDTLFILLSNYCPPPFIEAFNNTLYLGKLTANQLDSAGFINITANNFTRLDSIYRGLIIIPNSNPIHIAINNSIGIYQHYRSIEVLPRQLTVKVDGRTGNYPAELFIVDSSKNNFQFKYDSLIAAGYTQTSAVATVLMNQSISSVPILFNAGQCQLSMLPNAVSLIKLHIPGITSIDNNRINMENFTLYPNPVSETLTIKFSQQFTGSKQIQIYNSTGALVFTANTKQVITNIPVSKLAGGLYFIRIKNSLLNPKKFFKL
jgi:hypothetical protein